MTHLHAAGTEPRVKRAYHRRWQKTSSRFLLQPLSGKAAAMPAFDHPAIIEGRTVYPNTVRDPGDQELLKSGAHQAKVGGRVLKGRWKGMPIFCLTLEERATCPPECDMWRACYGNGMHWSHRFKAGPALEAGLSWEVADLARKFPQGFVVRLHILGDFYSVAYVELWRELLSSNPQLNVFGYSARWSRADPIAQALLKLASENWERFAIRFSNAPIEACSTITIEHEAQSPPDAIICPAQLGQTESCSTCALCWQTDRRIAFIRH